MGLFSFLGLGGDSIAEAIKRGAVIIDVRPASAFDQDGRVPGSVNIPLDRIVINVGRIRGMNKPIVLCCGYANDCAHAARILREKGVKEVHNGGSWRSVLKKVR
jgi:phage shock protein E